MPLSYSARLRRDLRDWQERGLIQPEQAERIAAHALAARGLRPLQTALALCILLLVAPSVIAFVAANWSAMSPPARLVVLVLADTAAVAGTYLAARRLSRDRIRSSRRVVDGLATLSLAIAAATLALVGQTFHVAADPRGFAVTVAILGAATALITRSGGAAIVACIALIAADAGLNGLDLGSLRGETGSGAGLWFWTLGPALFVASLTGWLPAREFTLLLLLIVLTNHLGGAPAGLTVLLPPDRILTVAALALALGHLLSRVPPRGGWPPRLHDGAQALARAAVGLNLIGIVMVAVRTLGFGGARPAFTVALAFAAIALAAFILARRRSPARATLLTSDLLVLAASALALLVWLIAGASREPSTFWTVWGGIVPALTLVVAGELEDRRELYGWGLALTAGLTVGMLAASSNLIAFSGNLLLCALLVTLALVACRWAARRIDGRAA
ncbi:MULTISPECIES: DUF2157 domain-containing protein [Methylobacterium]|uniref:DUF2157 domain-containing protein n=1 Tax=Methylobacterium longum TaxID=767694 RepID=A0ABT8AKY9_9HYPH|nr:MULTISPECIES: DUF2157 domain-containing protein [Methylobacterium]MCJ2099552.1 DUF2157 domain-containing protein [Methylobacterium sp. E-046]MDN3570454.1 DUF2157 domain-containing protein [Methylobacterium longum]GJE13751.1 hypothetical protein FOHLNKBM_4815 [Methylobacterium longum]